MIATYQPEVFNVNNEAEAKSIIMTPEGSSTEERWEKETPFLVSDICSLIKPDKDTLVLDFGCGIGRISKGLIEHSQSNMLGLDISASMRALSLQYVSNEKFTSVSPSILKSMIKKGLKVDACVSLWVLQHCPRVEDEIETIKRVLKLGGYLYILNNISSAIPTDKGWVSDGVDLKITLEKHFKLISYSKLPTEHTTEHISKFSFIGKYQYN